MAKRKDRMGLWIVGVRGSVGATLVAGLAALRNRPNETTGLITALPPFQRVGLVDTNAIVVGGHDIRSETLLSAVQGLHRRAGLFDESAIAAWTPELRAAERNIRPGTLCAASEPVRQLADQACAIEDQSPVDAVARLTDDIRAFRLRHKLARVVVINLATCERPTRLTAATRTFSGLTQALRRPGARVLPPSAHYAIAAVEAGCAYVNFTPSRGIEVPALRERADRLGLPYMGRDGKTGETLVKSALAPMFAMRNLAVRAWVGQNILGNRDGAALRDARTCSAKTRSKGQALSAIVPGNPHTCVSIDYVPSLDDWKVAWDFIHFEGFLGTKMSMQFTWQGCDSILAAPLVIDLARLTDLELRRGHGGCMRHLAFFFKDPLDVDVHDLATQWTMLVDHVTQSEANLPSNKKPAPHSNRGAAVRRGSKHNAPARTRIDTTRDVR